MEEEETAHFIPTELEEEILLRLPSNDLLSFKAVCKEWRRLISSRRFIQKHLERSIPRYDEACDPLTAYKSNSEIVDRLNNISTKKILLHNVKSILGSCDGLVLFLLRDRRIAAVNHSTGRYLVRTPYPSISNDIESRKYSWFGRHPGTGEYVLVLAGSFSTEQRNIVFSVYNLASNNQNPILSSSILSSSTDPLSPTCWAGLVNMGTFLHGRLHCPFGIFGSPDPEIVVLVHSFETNAKIEKILCPLKVNPTLGVVDGCLSAISVTPEACEVWVMKEYGNDKSWTKHANIEGCRITCGDIYSRIYPSNRVFQIIMKSGFCNNMDLALCYGYKGFAFIDSLVSPDSVFGENGTIVD